MHIIFISLPPRRGSIHYASKQVRQSHHHIHFWSLILGYKSTGWQVISMPLVHPNCSNCIMITVWPEFRANKIAHIKRFIILYEMGEISTCKGAEALRLAHEPGNIMDFAWWYLVWLQRFSVPSQITDTVKDLEWIVAHQKRLGELKGDGWVQGSTSWSYCGIVITSLQSSPVVPRCCPDEARWSWCWSDFLFQERIPTQCQGPGRS